MSAHLRQHGRATIADFLALPDCERFHELLGGEIVERAAPTGEHGGAQAELVTELNYPFGRGPGGRGPGRWWFATEVEIVFGGDVCRPDITGWRRDKVPERPVGPLIQAIPDWTCEILSDSNKRNDLIRKKRIYHQHHVSHYWIVDPGEQTITVHRWAEDGYTEILAGERGQRIRAEPFEEHELDVDVVFARG